MTDQSAHEAELARMRRKFERERNARLEAEAIAEKGLRDLYQREQQIQLFARVASAANQSQSVRDALHMALAEICHSMGWPVAHAYTVVETPQGVRLRSLAIWCADDGIAIDEFKQASEKLEFAPGVGLPGTVYATGEPVWEFDVTHSQNFPRRDWALRCNFKAGCAFPVILGKEVAAVLEFFTDKALERDESLLGLMAQVGLQLGRVIERSRAQERLVHDASHDALTGLPNRALFLDRLGQAIERRRARGAEYAVMFIDLDRFKIVNDSLGHLAGDTLIVQVGERLSGVLRRSDLIMHPQSLGDERQIEGTLARLGGDEFTILLVDIHDASDAARVANRVQEALRKPFQIEGQDIYTSASIGIATSSTDYQTSDEILRDADLAMYRAKSLGKARTELYDEGLHNAAVKRLALESDLRRALAQQDFVLHYQPIVALNSQEIVGFEALVRWRKADGTIVPPAEFMDVTEETGLIVFLGLWVLREACSMARRLHEEYPRPSPLTMSVNISPRQFQQADLVDQVRQVIKETGVDPRTVRLEITESTAAGDPERVIQILTQLKSIGIRLSIDDFGTGYSSLSYLQRFPLDVLKIDRSFVSAMHSSEESLQIVRTVMGLAKSLGMAVVAEGAEMLTQVTQLQSLGCEFGQGYYFSRPVDAAALPGLLAEKVDEIASAG